MSGDGSLQGMAARSLEAGLCWCVEGSWRLYWWLLKVCWSLMCWCVEGCWRLCCVEGWCVSVLKARSPQWLQQGGSVKQGYGEAQELNGEEEESWTWLSIYKDHPDRRVDSRWRLARRKAEDQALQIRMTLAWIRMVAGTGRRDIRCFSFMAVPCSL